MGHSVKRGDAKTLRWDLGRSLIGVTGQPKVLITTMDGELVLTKNGTVDTPPESGIISVALAATDYGEGQLEAGYQYRVEIETEPGPLTHPDHGRGFVVLDVLPDANPPE